jgi:hypothetical protein
MCSDVVVCRWRECERGWLAILVPLWKISTVSAAHIDDLADQPRRHRVEVAGDFDVVVGRDGARCHSA